MQPFDRNALETNLPDVRWRVTTATGVTFACCVEFSRSRIEVRLTTQQDSLVCARVVPSLEAASKVVRSWLHTVVSSDGAIDLISRHTHLVH